MDSSRPYGTDTARAVMAKVRCPYGTRLHQDGLALASHMDGYIWNCWTSCRRPGGVVTPGLRPGVGLESQPGWVCHEAGGVVTPEA
ncbi:MAG: hypothetical protein IPO15_24125 [Anaerolineae bacterium]|uniref:hypothetical protein n=1 Tax=Candidatus Amarolinea dominans TaxID=3140696 RepID=UPI0031357F2D|nr:hypothetical protein [Anaerolineae bacterium]